MKLSARNQFEGTVTGINKGAVNGIVTINVNNHGNVRRILWKHLLLV